MLGATKLEAHYPHEAVGRAIDKVGPRFDDEWTLKSKLVINSQPPIRGASRVDVFCDLHSPHSPNGSMALLTTRCAAA